MPEADGERMHAEVFELLPWYHNHTLDDLEHARVESHIRSCEECREELARCMALEDVTTTESEADFQPGERDLQRILQRIDALEGTTLPAPVRVRDRGSWLNATPRATRWVLAGQAAAIFLLALGFLLVRTEPTAEFETLTAAVAPARGEPRVQVVFADGVTELDLRSIVRGVNASIVAGPSERGVYELSLLGSEGAVPLEGRLATLRADPRVLFAELLPQRPGE